MKKGFDESKKNLEKIISYLQKKKKILFLTTSNRWAEEKEIPKSTKLAYKIKDKIGDSVEVVLIEIPLLKIYPCEGNVSSSKGNNCGVKEAVLKDKRKNPSGCHRCWASINNKDDELWKVSKELLKSDCVIFFGSVRWGQMNGYYQKLIERLTWLENMHSTLGEKNPVKNIEAGLIITGQNWNGKNVLKIQRKILGFFGFKINKKLFWNWQYTNDLEDESQSSYKKATKIFEEAFLG